MSQAQTPSKQILISAITTARQATYALLSTFDRTVLKKQNKIVILSYHSVAKDTWRFSVDPSVLKKQITYLQKNFDIISLQTVHAYIQGKVEITKPSVVLTFDDGYKDILTMRDFFKKNNIKPALFLLANTKTPNWKELGTKRPFLTKREILSLHKSGWEIGCHSGTHANLATLTDKEIQQETVSAKKALETHLGIKIEYFAYPRGKYNSRVLNFIKKAKYKMALTMDDGFITTKTDLLRVPRVGVDRTHSFKEFTATFSPSVVRVRKLVKDSPVGRYL
jgi:peptidoglycan/xylan/chitin deacetylase (PgdA/CDA1 family)